MKAVQIAMQTIIKCNLLRTECRQIVHNVIPFRVLQCSPIPLINIIRALSLFRELTWQHPVLSVTKNKPIGASKELVLIAKSVIKIFTRPILMQNITLRKIVRFATMKPGGPVSYLIIQKLILLLQEPI
jgi:hypothetical protein